MLVHTFVESYRRPYQAISARGSHMTFSLMEAFASDCSHNDNLECTAASVQIGAVNAGDTANCLTYATA